MTTTRGPDGVQPRFHSVAETAQILGVSEMTMYRAIRSGQFPAVQLMGRLIIPAKVIDEIIDAAIDSGALVATEEWTSGAERQPATPNELRRQRSHGREADAAGGGS
jgi:excisionase family DNA binding protein